MTDPFDHFRDTLSSAAPSGESRERGAARAMAAFDAEFPTETEAAGKSADSRQGSDGAARLTDRNQSSEGRRRVRSGRRSMRKWLLRGGLVAGGLSAVAALSTVIMIDSGVGGERSVASYFAKPLMDNFRRTWRESDAAPAPRSAPAPPAERQAVSSKSEQLAAADRFLEQSISQLSAEVEQIQQLEERGLASSSRLRAAERALAVRESQLAKLRGDTANAADAARRGEAISLLRHRNQQALAARGLAAEDSAARSLSPQAADADILGGAMESNPKFVLEENDGALETEQADLSDSALVETALLIEEQRDRFEDFEPSPVTSVAEKPVSTFSIDVDTASYAFLRGALNAGRIPPKDAIRVEELVNYFPYDYAGPDSAETPFKASVVVTPTPWNADTKLMHIGIKGYSPPVAERPRANLVFLIDTSGSMNQPNKLPLVINSLRLLLGALDEDDTVSIVVYAGAAGTVLEPTKASERAKIEAALAELRAGGSTAGAAGLRLAYQQARENFDAEAVNRVILATDGDFNVGFSSPDEMKEFVEKQRDSGVFLSVLGFGRGNYHDALMQALAQNGNGVAAYIDTLSEARKVLADEAGGALIPIAKDVKIQVEFNPAVISEYRLIGYETRALRREDFNNDAVDAGDIGSGHTVTAIYELTPKGSPAELVDPPRYSGNGAAPVVPASASDELAFVKIRYKQPEADESTLITRPVGLDDERADIADAPQETRFATAVAAFAQRLRREGRLGEYDFDDVIALAAAAKGDDPYGYRSEFVNLVRLAKSLSAQQ